MSELRVVTGNSEALVVESHPGIRAEIVARITAAWHKGREHILSMGNALIEAKSKLDHGDFLDMLERDLPFGPRTAQKFMRIASDPKLLNATHESLLPVDYNALAELERFSDEEFEAAITRGVLREGVTRDDIVRFRREIRQQTISHRPQSLTPPVRLPESGMTHQWHEMVGLLVARRKAFNLSQADLDEMVGWTETFASKYEIPHDTNGRIPGGLDLMAWVQALGCDLQLVPRADPGKGWRRETIKG